MTDTPSAPTPTPSLLRQFVTGAGWTLVSTVGERAIGLVQAILIARFLGIEDYGRYGLLFVTVGWIASVAGLQLGLTSTVEVARHRDTDPAWARAVVRLSEIVTLVLVLLVAGLIWLKPEMLGVALLGGEGYGRVMLLAGVMAALSVVTGLQDSVVQGYEDFQSLAIIRTLGAAVSLALVVALARHSGLDKVMLALALGTALRFVMVLVVKERLLGAMAERVGVREIWRVRDVLWSFSLPSVLANLIGGAVTWYGMVLLSGVQGGFRDLAAVTVGNQWRGMLLLGTTMLASVAIPMMTRLGQQGDAAGVSRLHGYNMWSNLLASLAAVVALCAASQLLLRAYGADFGDGWLVFCIMIVTVVPTCFIYNCQSYFVSQGQLWLQLAYVVGASVLQLACFLLLIGRWGGLGFAVAVLVTAVTQALVLACHGKP